MPAANRVNGSAPKSDGVRLSQLVTPCVTNKSTGIPEPSGAVR